jgi:hypothetical protein
MCSEGAATLSGRSTKKIDIFLTDRLARVTVFQNEATRPAGASYERRATEALAVSRGRRLGDGAASPWNRLKRTRKWTLAGSQSLGTRIDPRTLYYSRARANFWNARARCDKAVEPSAGIPCFSSELISPKVRPWPSGRKMGS